MRKVKLKFGKSMITIIFTVIMLVLVTLPAYSQTTSREGTAISITLVNQDPDPVKPGNYVDVRFKIENFGDKPIDNLQVELLEEYPFTLDPKEEKIKKLGTLLAFQSEDRAIIVKYKLRVAADAVEGTNELKVRYSSGGMTWTDRVFDINVETIDATIAISKTVFEPNYLEPGKTGTVSITVKNIADSVMEDVTFKLDLTFSTLFSQLGTSVSTTTFTELPFAPYSSATEKKIRLLKSGEEWVVKYDVIVSPSATAGIYKIPVRITYRDELENQITKDDIIGFTVNSKPVIDVTLDSTDIYTAGNNGKIVLLFVNRGLSDLKFLNAKLGDNKDYRVLSGTNQIYIGNLDSDDFDTAEFNIFVEPDIDKLVIPVEYTYRDALNNEFTEQKDITLNLYSDKEAVMFGLKSKKNYTWFIVVVLVIVAFFGYRAYRKRKKNK